MLENPPMWLNYNNSAKMSGPKEKKSGRGPTLFHTTVCIYICIYIYVCVCVCVSVYINFI